MAYKKQKKPTMKEVNRNMIQHLMHNEKFIFNVLVKIGIVETKADNNGRTNFNFVESKILKLREFLDNVDTIGSDIVDDYSEKKPE